MAAGTDLHTGNWSPDERYFTIARNTSLQYLDVTQSLVCSGHEEISLTGEPWAAAAWLPDGLLLAIDPQGDLNLQTPAEPQIPYPEVMRRASRRLLRLIPAVVMCC